MKMFLAILLFSTTAFAQLGQKTGTVVSDDNSVNAILGSSASFTGTCEDVRRYSEITVNLFGTPSVASGTLIFEFGPSCSNLDVSVPYTLTGPQSFVPLPLRVVLPFFRVRYVNGGTNLTAFRLTTVYHWESAKHITRVVNQSIDENEPVEMTRSIQAGKSPDGPYTNLPATGTVSSQSTNTPLAGDAVFNASGSIISTQGYLSTSLTVVSNVNSASNGIKFNWYADSAGTRSLGMTSFTYGNAPDPTTVQVPVKGPYLRITYTNGVSAQSTFELYSALLVTAPPPDVLPVGSTITANNAASIVKSESNGLKENGTYSSVGLSNSASLKVASTDRPSEVRNRISVINSIDHVSLSTTPTLIRTVTSGYKFYLLALVVSCLNDANANGRFNINDNATVVMPFSLAAKPAGAAPGSFQAIAAFTEPPAFTTNIRATEVAGDVICSITIGGYEEPL